MSELSPSLAPVVRRLEALLEHARRLDLRPGDLDEPLLEELQRIRALMHQAVAQEHAAAQEAAFSPSGLSALRPSPPQEPGPPEAPGSQPVRGGRL
jgi:hypothetical protein